MPVTRDRARKKKLSSSNTSTHSPEHHGSRVSERRFPVECGGFLVPIVLVRDGRTLRDHVDTRAPQELPDHLARLRVEALHEETLERWPARRHGHCTEYIENFVKYA